MAFALDISNFTEEVTPAEAASLKAAGFDRVIVQVVNERTLTHRQQIPVLLAAGLEVECYVYVWFSAGEAFVRDRVRWACLEAKAAGASDVMWLDCEQSDGDTPGFDYVHQPVSPIIRAAVTAVQEQGMQPGIYTAAWWWIPGASNSTEFNYLPLWDAYYDLDPDIDPVDYGGWQAPRMSQYEGSTAFGTVGSVDLNAYEPHTPASAPPPTPVSLPGLTWQARVQEAQRQLAAALEEGQ